jgi:hypothetical protein
MVADGDEAAVLRAAVTALEERMAQLEEAQILLLETVSSNLDFMTATNERLDRLEAR